MSEQEKKGWFRKAVDEYNKFCKELGLDKGSLSRLYATYRIR